MKIFTSLQVSIDFSIKFLIISLASGATLCKCTFPKFLNFSINFRENFDKILNNFQKIANFSVKFLKNCKFFIAFKIF